MQPHVVRHTENQEAYHLYLRGRHLWYSRSKGSLQRARELFEEAIAQDPNYVLPWVGLADLFAIQSLYGFEREEIANPRGAGRREPCARPQRPGGGCPSRSWDFRYCSSAATVGGRSRLRAQHRARPDERALPHLAGWPTWPGRERAALAAARRAQELDPLNPYIHSLAGAVYDFCGRAEEGRREFDKAFEIDPNYLVASISAGGVYSRLGRHDEALRVCSAAESS